MCKVWSQRVPQLLWQWEAQAQWQQPLCDVRAPQRLLLPWCLGLFRRAGEHFALRPLTPEAARLSRFLDL